MTHDVNPIDAPTSSSLSFDRAAAIYDETRFLPDDVGRLVRSTALHAMDDPPVPRFLELGIGTGRIARPFLEAGDDYVGVDLSLRMMRRLQEKHGAAHIAGADVAQLPFADATFDAAVAMHVFHLVGGWQRALDEARRVVEPHGWLLWSWHWRDEESVNVRLRRWLADEARRRGYSTERPGTKQATLQAALDRRGAQTRTFAVARWQTRTTTPGYEVEKLGNRVTSDTWMLPEDVLHDCVRVIRRRAIATYGSLDYREPVEERFILKVSRWPAP